MAGLPRQVEDVLNAALVCEFTVIDSLGHPITHPMLPLYDSGKVYMTSSALFSKKLDHIRANPKVAVAVTDLSATHGERLQYGVTVQGDASVIEDDPHTTWQRVMPLWQRKEPIIELFYSKRVALPLFWERALIEVTPRRIFLWDGGNTSAPPTYYDLAVVG